MTKLPLYIGGEIKLVEFLVMSEGFWIISYSWLVNNIGHNKLDSEKKSGKLGGEKIYYDDLQKVYRFENNSSILPMTKSGGI